MSNEVEIIESEVSLENEIVSELVKYNVTDAIIAGLKEKFLPLVERGKITNKEEFSEVIDARKECKTWRVTTTKICKKGREKAVLVQKAWIKKQDEVIGKISEVEDPLEKLEDEWTTEQERVKAEKKRMQEEQLANRQQDLAKMGVQFNNGNFELGDVSYEYALVKESDDDTYQTIFKAFKTVFDANEAERMEKLRKEQEAAAELQRQKDELAREQKEVAKAKAEIERQRLESQRKEQEKADAELKEKQRIQTELQDKRFKALFPFNRTGADVNMQTLWVLAESDFDEILATKKHQFEADQKEKERLAEEKRLADIEAAKQEAIQKEQARKAEEERLAEVKRKEEEARKAEELAKASDKVKYADLIAKFESIEFPEMRSGQYRKKVSIIKEKIEEIYSL